MSASVLRSAAANQNSGDDPATLCRGPKVILFDTALEETGIGLSFRILNCLASMDNGSVRIADLVVIEAPVGGRVG